MVLYILGSMFCGSFVGFVYSFLFLRSLNVGRSETARFDFWQALTFISRFIFIIVVVVVLAIYSLIDTLSFLFGVGVAFWISILVKLKVI